MYLFPLLCMVTPLFFFEVLRNCFILLVCFSLLFNSIFLSFSSLVHLRVSYVIILIPNFFHRLLISWCFYLLNAVLANFICSSLFIPSSLLAYSSFLDFLSRCYHIPRKLLPISCMPHHLISLYCQL